VSAHFDFVDLFKVKKYRKGNRQVEKENGNSTPLSFCRTRRHLYRMQVSAALSLFLVQCRGKRRIHGKASLMAKKDDWRQSRIVRLAMEN
jgi:hypothetical protein